MVIAVLYITATIGFSIMSINHTLVCGVSKVSTIVIYTKMYQIR
jgi:hypothetical protein